jgi:erythromycin esterase-like protein
MNKKIFGNFAYQILVLYLVFSANIPISFPQQTQNKVGETNGHTDDESSVVTLIREAAHLLTGNESDYNPLMELIGNARFVMLGEATHGTHEFYRERARITRRLIEEKGFDAVVIEADWTDVNRVNSYIHGEGGGTSAKKALSVTLR